MPFRLMFSIVGSLMLAAPGPEVSAAEINGLLLVLALSLVLALAAYWHTRYSPQVTGLHGETHASEAHATDAPADAQQHTATASPPSTAAVAPPVEEAVITPEPAAPPLEAAVEAAPSPTVEPVEADDLTRIEGIGPKIAAILHNAGISTYARLAETPVETLQSILEAAGSRFRLADPASWPQQARHAAAGEWDVLIALQERLKGGQYRQD